MESRLGCSRNFRKMEKAEPLKQNSSSYFRICKSCLKRLPTFLISPKLLGDMYPFPIFKRQCNLQVNVYTYPTYSRKIYTPEYS